MPIHHFFCHRFFDAYVSAYGSTRHRVRLHPRATHATHLDICYNQQVSSADTMPTSLDKSDIDNVLRSCKHAHLGCSDASEPYVVPISYVFKDGAIYGYTHVGKKITMMRKNPRVCICVGDYVERRWRSVIIMGTYEELSGESRSEAVVLLSKQINNTQDILPFLPDDAVPKNATDQRIIYKINITEMTGRLF